MQVMFQRLYLSMLDLQELILLELVTGKFFKFHIAEFKYIVNVADKPVYVAHNSIKFCIYKYMMQKQELMQYI